MRVAANNNYGIIFTGTLLLVVMVTSFTLRGLKSVVAIALLIVMALLFAQFGLWDDVLRWFGGVDIRMNAGGHGSDMAACVTDVTLLDLDVDEPAPRHVAVADLGLRFRSSDLLDHHVVLAARLRVAAGDRSAAGWVQRTWRSLYGNVQFRKYFVQEFIRW